MSKSIPLSEFIAMTKKPAYSLHISTGNTKTHLPSFNLLAGCGSYDGYAPHKYDGTVARIHGTCNVNCTGCYAKKLTRYDSNYFNYYENTLLIREQLPRFIEQMTAILTANAGKWDVFRIHDSGDFDNYNYFKAWVTIARRFPSITFYTYTKRTDILRRYLNEGGCIPANLTINLSFWAGVCEDMIEGFPRFEYDDGTSPAIASLHHCPAVDPNGKRTGKSCKDCLRCAHAKAGNIWAVYAH